LWNGNKKINGILHTTRKACVIARYYLYDDRATDQVQKLSDQAIKYL